MAALQIRNVPDDVREALAERARAKGQSLQAFLLAVVEEEAQRSRNVAVLERFSDRTDGSRLTSDELAAEIDQSREERDARLVEDATDRARDAS